MAVNRKPPRTGTPGWVRLGELLQERRERELDPRFYNRDAFAAASGVNLRLAQEIELNRRENITPVTLRDVIAPGYQVTFESVRAVVAEVPGAGLVAAPGSPPCKARGLRPVPAAQRADPATPAAPAGFISEAMEEAARPYVREIWRKLLEANPGYVPGPRDDDLPDASGARLFGEGFDAQDWDRMARRGLTVRDRTWVLAATQVREAEARGRETGTGLPAGSQAVRTERPRLSPVDHDMRQMTQVAGA